MHRITAVLAAASAVTAATLAGMGPALAAHQTGRAPAASYYLSLGDSLAQGVQPNSSGTSVETNQGYADQLFTALKGGNPALRLAKLGCPGETTATMIKGGLCTYPKGSQLAQAVAFLKEHAGHVQLVTIDIGANDLNPCLVLTSVPKIVACLTKVFPKMVTNLEKIMTALRGADPGLIIGMKYYDPELAGWLQGTPAARALATDSVTLAEVFDKDLSTVYKAFKARVADVYTAFHTANLKSKVTLPAFGVVPKDVAYICFYTWECAPPPVGPNEHANALGYGVIANAFLAAYLK
jgi:lysophospholipase L1-like esterase